MTNIPFIWNPSEDSFYFKTESKVFEKICKRYGLSKKNLLEEFHLRTKLLFALYKKRIYNFTTVQKIINEYYKNPEAVLKKYLREGSSLR